MVSHIPHKDYHTCYESCTLMLMMDDSGSILMCDGDDEESERDSNVESVAAVASHV